MSFLPDATPSPVAVSAPVSAADRELLDQVFKPGHGVSVPAAGAAPPAYPVVIKEAPFKVDERFRDAGFSVASRWTSVAPVAPNRMHDMVSAAGPVHKTHQAHGFAFIIDGSGKHFKGTGAVDGAGKFLSLARKLVP